MRTFSESTRKGIVALQIGVQATGHSKQRRGVQGMGEYQEVESAARSWRRRRRVRRLHPSLPWPSARVLGPRPPTTAAADAQPTDRGMLQAGRRGTRGGCRRPRRAPSPPTELVLLKQPRFGYYLQNNRDPINCFTHSHLVLIVID